MDGIYSMEAYHPLGTHVLESRRRQIFALASAYRHSLGEGLQIRVILGTTAAK